MHAILRCAACSRNIRNNQKALKEIGMALTLDEVILELYRLAETKQWVGKTSDEALAAAIEGMEHLWTLRQADRRRSAAGSAKKQPRVWS